MGLQFPFVLDESSLKGEKKMEGAGVFLLPLVFIFVVTK